MAEEITTMTTENEIYEDEIERAEWYRHSDYGCVFVTDITRRIDVVDDDDGVADFTIMVRFNKNPKRDNSSEEYPIDRDLVKVPLSEFRRSAEPATDHS